MQITNVSVRVRNAHEAGDFYAGVLGLDVAHEFNVVVVTLGATRLELVEDPAADGDHHFAITIPTNKFDEAKTWIQQRTVLLGTSEADDFECSPAWNARSLYFSGHDRSVLELIVRRDLDNSTAGPFSSADLLRISEVGVVVADVPATVATLTDDAEIAPYGDAQGDAFAPVGDLEGMLILVAPGRTWFPTADRTAEESPVFITAIGGRPGTYSLGALGSLHVLLYESPGRSSRQILSSVGRLQRRPRSEAEPSAGDGLHQGVQCEECVAPTHSERPGPAMTAMSWRRRGRSRSCDRSSVGRNVPRIPGV